MHIGVVFDLDVLSGSIFRAADPGSIPALGSNFGIAGDGDVFTIPSRRVRFVSAVIPNVIRTADPGGIVAAIGIHIGIAGNSDVGAITAMASAANARTGVPMSIIIASLGSTACTDISAGDGDVGSIVDLLSTGIRLYFALSADAGTATATAYYSQRTGIAAGRIAVLVFLFVRATILAIILIVRDGQRAGAFSISLFQTGVGTGAGQRVVPVQLNVGVAIALHGQRSLGIAVLCALPVDKHILQGHIGSLIFCRLHRDGI